MRKINIVTIFNLVFLVIIIFGNAQSNEEEIMTLSSLKPGRVLKKRWIGMIPEFPEGVWLECGSADFLVRNPLNLTNHVYIKTTDEALEYVRFFTNDFNFEYFDLNHMVEITPKHDNKELGIWELLETVFIKHFRRASIKEMGPGEYDDRKEGCCRGRQYSITRTVLMSDSTIYEIVELVCDDGFYDIESKKEIMKVNGAWSLPLSTLIK